MFFSIMFSHRILNIVPYLLAFLGLLWSLPFDSSFFALSIYICYTSSCHEKEIDHGVTQTCVQIQALPFFPVFLSSCSVTSDSLWPHVLKPARLLCSWDSPGKNIGMGCHSLSRGSRCYFGKIAYLSTAVLYSRGDHETFQLFNLFSLLYCVSESRGDFSALKGSILIFLNIWEIKFTVVQSLSCVQLFVTPWTIVCQASLSSTVSWSLLRFMSTELVAVSNHLFCLLLLLLHSIFPGIRVFPTERLYCYYFSCYCCTGL